MADFKRDWNQMARAYEDFTGGEDSYSNVIEWPCIRALLPSLRGKRVLDLGCGTGRFTFLLEREQPAALLGIDLSDGMLAIARENAVALHSRAEFRQGDLSQPLDLPTADVIFSSTTLHYIADLRTLFRQWYALLAPGGCCVLSLMHPVYSAQYPVDRKGVFPQDDDWQVRYLDPSPRAYVQPWIEYNDALEDFLCTSFHHTCSDYLNAMLEAGFQLARVEEPAPPASWKERMPERYDAFLQTPSFLIVKLVKPAV